LAQGLFWITKKVNIPKFLSQFILYSSWPNWFILSKVWLVETLGWPFTNYSFNGSLTFIKVFQTLGRLLTRNYQVFHLPIFQFPNLNLPRPKEGLQLPFNPKNLAINIGLIKPFQIGRGWKPRLSTQ